MAGSNQARASRRRWEETLDGLCEGAHDRPLVLLWHDLVHDEGIASPDRKHPSEKNLEKISKLELQFIQETLN